MKVVFFIRANNDKVKGGDLMQIDLTAKYLRKAGVVVDYSSDARLDISSYDLVHSFNSPRFDETKEFFEAAKKAHKPIAFSTIYWPKTEYVVGVSNSLIVKTARVLLGSTLSCWLVNKLISVKEVVRPNHNRAIEKWLFASANMLLPNSGGEMRQIRKYYHIKEQAYRSVRNAVEPNVGNNAPTISRSGVLSVGRIEPRKNTLKLINACRELDLKLTLIGGYDPKDTYALECLRRVKENGFVYKPNMDPKKLSNYYHAAEIHAMASWYETPGLATMEAAAAGCKIVTTNRGSTTEYFGDNVEYCDPFSYRSIKNALQAAVANELDPKLAQQVLSNYTWEHTAADTLGAYKELVS